MKKTTKTLATIIMLSAMVGFMGCTTSLGEDEKTPPVPVQPAEPDKPTTPGEQEKPGKPDGQGGTEGTEKPGETTKPEEEGKPPVGPDTEGQEETETPGGNTNPEGDGESGGSSEQGGTEGGNQQEITPVLPTKIATKTINTKEYDIVTFGQWPQTEKDPNVELVGNETTKVNGWDCYSDADGNYYVLRKIQTNKDSKENVEPVYEDHYYKLEPIQWRVLTNDYDGKKLLFSEKQLDAMKYSDTSNQYDTSKVRSFLNNDFYNKAFSEGEKAAISKTTVDNSNASTIGKGQADDITNKNLCGNTTDNIFLLSVSEMTNEAYGFYQFNNNDKDPLTMSRTKASTDYTAATGTWIRNNDSTNTYNGNGCYWLRSPIIITENIYEIDEVTGKNKKDENGKDVVIGTEKVVSVQIIGEDGRNGTSPINGLFGIAPALTISNTL